MKNYKHAVGLGITSLIVGIISTLITFNNIYYPEIIFGVLFGILVIYYLSRLKLLEGKLSTKLLKILSNWSNFFSGWGNFGKYRKDSWFLFFYNRSYF